MSQPPRFVRTPGWHEPDLPPEKIDELFYAALAQIKASHRGEAPEPKHLNSSLSTSHPMPRWFKW